MEICLQLTFNSVLFLILTLVWKSALVRVHFLSDFVFFCLLLFLLLLLFVDPICLWHSFLYSVRIFFSVLLLSANTYNDFNEFFYVSDAKMFACTNKKKNITIGMKKTNTFAEIDEWKCGTHIAHIVKQNQMLSKHFVWCDTFFANRLAWNRDMAEYDDKKIRRTMRYYYINHFALPF